MKRDGQYAGFTGNSRRDGQAQTRGGAEWNGNGGKPPQRAQQQETHRSGRMKTGALTPANAGSADGRTRSANVGACDPQARPPAAERHRLGGDGGKRRGAAQATAAAQAVTAAQAAGAAKAVTAAPAADAAGGGKRSRNWSERRPSAEDVRTGDRIVVTIKRIGINGEGVGYYRRKAVFIDGALPGEVVRARVVAVEPKRLVAEAVQTEKRSPQRVDPPCPIYEACGGCQLQHLAYDGQLAAKEELVRESFARYAGLDGAALPLRPMLGMDEPWRYRNKAQLQAGRGADGRPVLGLYEPGSRRLVDIVGADCMVQQSAINAAAAKVLRVLERLGVPLAERSPGTGLRTVVLRVAQETGELQLTLVAAHESFAPHGPLVEAIRQEAPEIASISLNINAGDTPVVFGDRTVTLWGAPALHVSLGDLTFALSPRAFFQLNTVQTVKLYDAVLEAAALTGRETVVDAYCGTGTIGLWLAPHAREVRGVETVREAVLDAQQNAALNGRNNARFYVGKAEELLPRWVREGFRPDVIVVDPPRTGCDARLLKAIADARPKRLVYVSCNPSTLAKDCRYLLDAGFSIEWLQPVDMFPQTSHVECCSLLVRNE